MSSTVLRPQLNSSLLLNFVNEVLKFWIKFAFQITDNLTSWKFQLWFIKFWILNSSKYFILCGGSMTYIWNSNCKFLLGIVEYVGQVRGRKSLDKSIEDFKCAEAKLNVSTYVSMMLSLICDFWSAYLDDDDNSMNNYNSNCYSINKSF